MVTGEPNHWALGTTVSVKATFQSAADGSVYDPATVTCRTRIPDGTKTAYVYGVDSQLVKDATGKYHLLIETPDPGRYDYRWEGANGAAAAGDSFFWVDDSVFET